MSIDRSVTVFSKWFSGRVGLVGLVAASLLVVAGPVAVAEAVVPVEGVASVAGVQREYRLVSATFNGSRYANGYDTTEVVIPQPPAGVVYVKWDVFASSGSPGEMSGALLRSDGKMVGFGGWGSRVVAAIDREFPDAKIVDFAELQWAGGYLIFADGTVGRTSGLQVGGFVEPGGPYEEVLRRQLAGPWDMPGQCAAATGAEFVRFLPGADPNGNEMLLLRADGRAVSFAVEAGKRRCGVSKAGGYVGGFIMGLPDYQLYRNLKVMLRKDGRVDTYDHLMTRIAAEKCVKVDNNKKGLFPTMCAPKLPKGVRYVGVASSDPQVVAYLRSDGKMVYRAKDKLTKVNKQQPPRLPAGLEYVSLEASWNSWILMRSDGQAVVLDGGYKKNADDARRLLYGDERYLPQLAKGWRYVSGAIIEDFQTAFLVEKIPTGQKVATGIEKIKTPKTVRQGKTAKVTVKVASRAILDGGTVKVTHKGKTIGKARIKGTKATVKIKTRTMKPKGKNTIGVQYLGNNQAKKSTKAKTTVTTRF